MNLMQVPLVEHAPNMRPDPRHSALLRQPPGRGIVGADAAAGGSAFSCGGVVSVPAPLHSSSASTLDASSSMFTGVPDDAVAVRTQACGPAGCMWGACLGS